MSVVYYPYTHPSRRFGTLRECHAFMDSGVCPWHTFHSSIGVFVVRENLRTGNRTLYTHFFPWQKENLKLLRNNPKKFVCRER